MRGGAGLAELGAAPHPALEPPSPVNGRRKKAAPYFFEQSFSRVVDIAAAAEKP